MQLVDEEHHTEAASVEVAAGVLSRGPTPSKATNSRRSRSSCVAQGLAPLSWRRRAARLCLGLL